MSDNDKMRKEFEKWYMTNTFAHVDHLSVFYNDLNCYSTPIANHCWKAWQAAQSVPVVGEVPTAEQVGEEIGIHASAWDCIDPEKIIAAVLKLSKPTHSITEAELERLRKDAERGRLLIERGEWFRFDHDTPDAHALLAVRLPYNVDLSCKPTREDAIDAAVAAEGEKG